MKKRGFHVTEFVVVIAIISALPAMIYVVATKWIKGGIASLFNKDCVGTTTYIVMPFT